MRQQMNDTTATLDSSWIETAKQRLSHTHTHTHTLTLLTLLTIAQQKINKIIAEEKKKKEFSVLTF